MSILKQIFLKTPIGNSSILQGLELRNSTLALAINRIFNALCSKTNKKLCFYIRLHREAGPSCSFESGND